MVIEKNKINSTVIITSIGNSTVKALFALNIKSAISESEGSGEISHRVCTTLINIIKRFNHYNNVIDSNQFAKYN